MSGTIDRQRTGQNQGRGWASRLCLVLLALGSVGVAVRGTPAHAQVGSSAVWTRDSIQSSVLGEIRQLRVALPLDYEAPQHATERYAVLFVLNDALRLTLTIVNAHALSASWAPAIPRLIIVGVETPESTRFRDMTWPGFGGPLEATGGGAPAFLRFLSMELRPYIAARYRTNSATVLAGHSMSALFTLWAFGRAPDFLMGGIATSPSLPLNEGGPARHVLDGVRARTTPGRLFLAAGSHEGVLDSATAAFSAALRSDPVPGLDVEYQQMSEAAHPTVAAVGIVPGLRHVFRPVSLSASMFNHLGDEAGIPRLVEVFDSTRAEYMSGARELGLPERLPLSFLLYQSRRQYQESAPLTLRVCEELIASYPTLWNGYECAADAQLGMDRRVEAAENYRQAIDMARRAGDSATADRISRKAEELTRSPQRPRGREG